MAEDGGQWVADFRIGYVRLPAVDAEAHAEVEAIGEVLQENFAVVRVHVNGGIALRSAGQGRANLAILVEDRVADGLLDTAIRRPGDAVSDYGAQPVFGRNELGRYDERAR